MFNVGLIDSLKLRIQLDKIKVIDKRIISQFIKYYPEEDLIDEQVNNAEPYVIKHNGITYRYYIKAFINSKKIAVDYLVLQISAKMVKTDYFSGITKTNYKNIIEDINAQNIVKISESAFLNGLVSDIDICINQLINEKSLLGAVSLIRQFPKPSCKPLIHFIHQSNKFGKIINLGVDFNKREKATNTRPYCKIYHKGIELQTKSIDFYNAYLQPQKKAFLDNLVRYEFTIKAYQHKNYLTEKKLLLSDLKTFEDLITIKQSQLTEIAKSGLKHYLEPKKQASVIDGLKPIERIVVNYMQQIINHGGDLDNLKDVLNQFENKSQRSQSKTYIMNLYKHLKNENPSVQSQLDKNKNVNDFLTNIGY